MCFPEGWKQNFVEILHDFQKIPIENGGKKNKLQISETKIAPLNNITPEPPYPWEHYLVGRNLALGGRERYVLDFFCYFFLAEF